MVEYMSNLGIFKESTTLKLVLSENCVWITNYIKILNYSEEEIKLKIKENTLVIEGVGFNIKLLEKRELLIGGKVNKIYLEKTNKDKK